MGALTDTAPTGAYAGSAFFTGFLEGYNTMDALASLAFGIILIEVIQNLGITDSKDVCLCTIRSGILAALLMALIYGSLAFMGAQSVSLLGVSADGGLALSSIANHYLGGIGGLFLGIMITFACLKTAIGLVTACSTTFSELFPPGSVLIAMRRPLFPVFVCHFQCRLERHHGIFSAGPVVPLSHHDRLDRALPDRTELPIPPVCFHLHPFFNDAHRFFGHQ